MRLYRIALHLLQSCILSAYPFQTFWSKTPDSSPPDPVHLLKVLLVPNAEHCATSYSKRDIYKFRSASAQRSTSLSNDGRPKVRQPYRPFSSSTAAGFSEPDPASFSPLAVVLALAGKYSGPMSRTMCRSARSFNSFSRATISRLSTHFGSLSVRQGQSMTFLCMVVRWVLTFFHAHQWTLLTQPAPHVKRLRPDR